MSEYSEPSRFDTLKAVVDGIDDVIYISDPHSHDLLHVNDSFRQIWGEDVIGKKCYKILQNRSEPCDFCTNDKIFNEYLGRSYVWEFQNEVTGSWFRCSDKAIQWVDGRMVRFELASDITELKTIEAELKESRKELIQSNRDLQQFAYVASHDLQEPLRMVSSFTQLVADRYKDKLDEKANKWMNFAVDGANRMQVLIQDLLSFSRVNTHGVQFKPIELNQVLSTVKMNLKLAMEESGARISAEKLPVVSGDQGQLILLFQNLISNAIKFCLNAQPDIHISFRRQQGEWVISVRDNGIGIEDEYLDKIFIIFQRLHARDEYPGTGLGLAVCKRIVQRHGGQIWVTSKPGSGSTFFLSLPPVKE